MWDDEIDILNLDITTCDEYEYMVYKYNYSPSPGEVIIARALLDEGGLHPRLADVYDHWCNKMFPSKEKYPDFF